MAQYATTLDADADLSKIWDYTDEKWGRLQARKYLTELEDRFSAIAQFPERGKCRDDIPGTPLSYHEGRHMIFYRTTQRGIEIIRVLHDSMDFPRHFT